MMITPGEFWVAAIPYTDGSATKKRPVLLLWLDEQDAVVAVVTSASPRTNIDVELNDWQQSSLRVASTVRLSRLDCLEQSLMLAQIGIVSETDAQRLKQIWQTEMQLQF